MIIAIKNKKKIVNDPIYGFIQIPSELIFDIIHHPLVQRLRRIKQLGLTHYVYPGATHTRFQHVLGAMHLMKESLNTLKLKGHNISSEEEVGALIAILLHDLGHGPFSHTLESSIFEKIPHEVVSLSFMEILNKEFSGQLSTGIAIFSNKYPRKFFHQLVSSQLDMDRLDYLRRDSYFTGVTEGVIGSDRIIKMLNISNNELVIEEKGIYSIEKFLIARRLMYWQVYLHKTVIASEQMLIKVIKRAKSIHAKGEKIFLTPSLKFFFDNKIDEKELLNKKIKGETPLEAFSKLDDSDVVVCLKQWQFHPDRVLSIISKGLVDRDLFKVSIQGGKFKKDEINTLKEKVQGVYNLPKKDLKYFIISDSVKNNAYSKNTGEQINIMGKNNQIRDIAIASDVSNVSTLSRKVEKFFICHPKLF